jgi:hypothetical protein
MNVTKVEYESNSIELINSLNKLPKEVLNSINLIQDINDKIFVKTHFTEGRGKNAHIHTQIFDYPFFHILIKHATPEFLDYALTEWTKKYPLQIENFSPFLNVLFENQDMNKIDVAFKYLKEFKNKNGRDLTYHISNIISRDGYALGLMMFLNGSKKELTCEEFKPIWDKYLELNYDVLGFSKVVALHGIFVTMLNRDQLALAKYVIEETHKENKEVSPVLAYSAFEHKALDLFKNIVDIHSNKKSTKKIENKDKVLTIDVDAFEEERLYRYHDFQYSKNNSFESIYELFLNLALNNGDIDKNYYDMLNYLDNKKLVKLNQQNVDIMLATQVLLASKEKNDTKVEQYLDKTFKYFKKTGLSGYISLLNSCVNSQQEKELIMPLLKNENYKNEFSKELSELAEGKLYDYLKSNGEVSQQTQDIVLNLANYIDDKKTVFDGLTKTPLREKLLLEIEMKSQDLKIGKKIKL